MVKIRLRKGPSARWIKGSACSSNPKTRKFRDQVFNPFRTNSSRDAVGLTGEKLSKLDEMSDAASAISGFKSRFSSISGTSGQSAVYSISGLSECTNQTFASVLRLWKSPSSQHKEVCAALAAVTEVVQAQGGEGTETEYFAALVTALHTADTPEVLEALLFLLNLVIKKVSAAMLKKSFSTLIHQLHEIMKQQYSTGSASLLRSVVVCLTTLLQGQDLTVWLEQSTLRVYIDLLSMALHEKPKVRKTACDQVSALFKVLMVNHAQNPVGKKTLEFFEDVFSHGLGSKKDSSILHLTGFIKKTIPFFTCQHVKVICERILGLLTLSDSFTQASCFGIFEALFSAIPSEQTLPAELNGKLITALYSFQPNVNDAFLVVPWLGAIEAGYSNLFRLNPQLCTATLKKLFSTLMTFLLAKSSEARRKAAELIKKSANFYVMLQESTTSSEESSNLCSNLVSIVQGGLGFSHRNFWGLVLSVLEQLFNLFGKYCGPRIKDTLITLCDLVDVPEFAFRKELEHTVGAAVRSLGPKLFLSMVSLGLDKPYGECEFPRAWLLPVLKTYIEKAELKHFAELFLPLSVDLQNKAQTALAAKQDLEFKVYDILQYQVWSLLPSYCNYPMDFVQSFKNIARVLGTALEERADLRTVVLQALKNLLTNTASHCADAESELARFAKNYIPIMFNLYLGEKTADELSVPLLEVIRLYMRIADVKLVAGFYSKCMDRLPVVKETKAKSRVLDLVLTMVCRLGAEDLQALFTQTQQFVKMDDITMKRKGYRLLQEVTNTTTEPATSLVRSQIATIKSLMCTLDSSSRESCRAPRLKCIRSLLALLNGEECLLFIQMVLPEVVLSCKGGSVKARKTSLNLLEEIGKVLVVSTCQPAQDCALVYTKMILAGLSGSPQMVSCCICALTHLVRLYKGQLDLETVGSLIEQAILLMRSTTKLVVKESLGLLKVLISASSSGLLSGHLPSMLEGMFTLGKEVCRQEKKVCLERLLRKFDIKELMLHCPTSQKNFLMNTHKSALRLKRTARSHNNTDSRGDQNEDSGLTRIIEDQDGTPVDLLSPNAIRHVIASRGGKSGMRSLNESDDDRDDISIATDGRLVIKENTNDAVSSTSKPAASTQITKGTDKKISKKRKFAEKENSSEEEVSRVSYKSGGRGIHRDLKQQQKGPQVQAGDEYRAKKAKGDMKIKGKPDPYAYIPINRQSMSKRKGAKARGQFKQFVKAKRKP